MRTLNRVITGAVFGAASAGATGQTGTVTVYGVADVFVQAARGADRLVRVLPGGLVPAQLGFRGTEDMGDGLRAVFVLESGVNLDDGTFGQNAYFGRQAYVGVVGRYGQVSLGRQYGSLFPLTNEFSAFGNRAAAASTAIIGGFGGYEPVRGSAVSATGNGGPARWNNAIKVETPDYSGFRAGAVWGFGEVVGSAGDNRVIDVYARYKGGPLDLMVAAVSDKTSTQTPDVDTIAIGAAYRFGDARVLGGALSVNDRSPANQDGEGYWLGGDYRVGLHLVRAQYVVSKAKFGSNDKTQAMGVGYQYDLSRRTALYTSWTYFKNDGGATFAGRWASALPAGLTTPADRNINELIAGVRHSF